MVLHQYECKISHFLSILPISKSQKTSQILLTLSAVLKHPVQFHLEVFDNWRKGVEPQEEDKEKVAYFGLHNLLKHFEDIDLLQHFASTLTILKLLTNLNYFSGDIKNEDELKLGQVICHYYAAVLPNVHAISEQHFTPENQTKTEMVAIGLFPTVASHLNHSCDPNTFVIDIGREKVTVAARTILPGEEICHIYYGHFGDTAREKRQAHLLQKYHFTCGCDACKNDYPNAKECLAITKNFAQTPKERLLGDLSREDLEKLDEQNDKLHNLTESALSKNMVPLALEASKKRIGLISKHLKHPHILHLMGRCSMVNYMWYMYGNTAFQSKPKQLPCYF